jgi:DNA-binding transcriptional ArsR family regulator
MPAPARNLIAPTDLLPIQFGLEPVRNNLHSLFLLAKDQDPAGSLSGFGEWIGRTWAAMSPEERHRHRLIMVGFHYAVQPRRSWPSFPAYLEHLAALPPAELPGRLMRAYQNLPWLDDSVPRPPLDEVLSSPEAFLVFLGQRFDPEHVDPALERQAYGYIIDPPAMQQLIVSHLGHMWHTYLAAEWSRVLPMLQDAVTAFSQVDFSAMSLVEAAEFVTGQSLENDHWMMGMLDKAEQLIFVPSAHIGPYLGLFHGDSDTQQRVTGLVFGARLPQGVSVPGQALSRAADLSRAEILVRLTALADDTRLQILRLVATAGELRSQDIIHELQLSQSAASRHLKQLSATGYLVERRCDGAKCYRLNADRLDDTLRAVSAFLLNSD